ncbi:MAG: alpha/beta hydrolase [Mycobacteriaceae bacterium]|nr:alpha/beta hydrolase [Mycobacteriaceae bacterium]
MKRVLLIVALVLAAVIVVVNITVAKLPTMPAADGKYVSLRGKEIHYIEQPGQGVPVVMVHGLPGSNKDFAPLLARLPGAHVFCIDRPGFGWSKGGWMPYQDQIDLMHDFVTQLHLGPAIIVGWSFGGSLALGVARRYPDDVAKLILLAPGGGGLKSEIESLLQARYLLFSQLPVVKSVIKYTVGNIALRLSVHFAVRHAFAPGPVDPSYQARLEAVNLTPGNLDAFAHEQLEWDQTGQWVDDNAPEIHVPVTDIVATDDRLVPVDHGKRLAQSIPGAELITVDGSHMIPYTHPDAVVAEISKALARA